MTTVDDGLGLVKYDEMVRAIAVCEEVDEVKEIRDRAMALEKYMAQQGNTEAERLCCNVRLRAERRAGEILHEMLANGERASASEPGPGRGRQKVSNDTTPLSLADLGVTRDQASRFQQLAKVPGREFEAALAQPDKPSTSGILRERRVVAVGAPMDPDALWLWGRLRDFEQRMGRMGTYALLEQMTDGMRKDVRRLAPLVSRFLGDI